ncbi:hypothetical protein [Kitasatospora sp. NPDC005856]|uniref:hypothetical protein n=1 Tax=Kitasatospora sp. NPDC005856 TaxID=3154566 RepID=UPI0033D79166
MTTSMSLLAARLTTLPFNDPTSAPSGSFYDVGKNFKPEVPSGEVGSALTTIVNWTMGGCLALVVAALCACAAMDSFGSISDKPDVSARGKAGMPKCFRAAVVIGLAWPIVALGASLKG